MTQCARPLSDWHEDFGPVLWWCFPVREPPYVGTPLDAGLPVEVVIRDSVRDYTYTRHVGGWPGHHTHWTPLPEPPERSPIPLPKIVTRNISPPIPLRQFDWCAYVHGEEERGECGYGRTRAEAVADLINSYLQQE
jgi:hypothetical protein